MISEQFGEFLSVVGVFVNTELQVLAELFVELLEVFSVFNDLMEELNALLGDVLLDYLEDLVVLQIFSGNVKRKIFRINNTSDESKIFRDQLFAIVHNEDSSNVQFNIIFLLLGFEHIEWSSFRNENNRSEFKTTFN